LICPSSPSEAFIFRQLRGNEVSFPAKVLAGGGGGGWIADIWKEDGRLRTWIGIDVTLEDASVLL
jgi:hypothetical protein